MIMPCHRWSKNEIALRHRDFFAIEDRIGSVAFYDKSNSGGRMSVCRRILSGTENLQALVQSQGCPAGQPWITKPQDTPFTGAVDLNDAHRLLPRAWKSSPTSTHTVEPAVLAHATRPDCRRDFSPESPRVFFFECCLEELKFILHRFYLFHLETYLQIRQQ